MGIIDIIHAILNIALATFHLAQNGPWGWKTVDRKSGRMSREQQSLFQKLKLLVLFNPLTEWLDKTHLLRLSFHNKNIKSRNDETTSSKKRIRNFVRLYKINMDEYSPSDVSKYSTFEEFITRKHAPGARPITDAEEPSAPVAVADSRMVAYDTVSQSQDLWIKGKRFNITNLVMDTDLGARFADGPVAAFHLSPQDGHCFYSPVAGTIKQYRSMPGEYYQLDPLALRSRVDILTSNARSFIVIDTKEYGDVLFAAVGAHDVGSVRFHEPWHKPGAEIRKGEELGCFEFGGSSIILAFEKDRMKFDHDLLEFSKRRIQVSVEVGMRLGTMMLGGQGTNPWINGDYEDRPSFSEVVKDGQ